MHVMTSWTFTRPCLYVLVSLALASCSGSGSDSPGQTANNTVASVFGECGSGASIELPCGFPTPREEENNPLSLAKIELGRLLFYDRNMSFNQTQSCADCHQQDKAFTDGLTVSVGSQGDFHARNAMSMTNVVYNGTLNWANNQVVNLDEQALAVITNESPVELGWTGHEDEILARLKSPSAADYAGTAYSVAAPDYPTMFQNAFPDAAEKITMFTVTKAFAAFGSTMISGDSDFDKEQRAEANNMSDSAKRGRELFFSERLECFHCHGGFNFSDSVDHAAVKIAQNTFHNNALYNLDGNGLYPAGNHGLREFTLLAEDEGKFRAPTLRNIELTAPYMHDGSIATLDEVIDHYARGGRLITVGPNAGDGALNPNRSSLINGFVITADERLDLIEFFKSLTDWKFVCRDELSDPFGNVPKNAMCP
jgi:cytochrome c peroxidase